MQNRIPQTLQDKNSLSVDLSVESLHQENPQPQLPVWEVNSYLGKQLYITLNNFMIKPYLRIWATFLLAPKEGFRFAHRPTLRQH